ncbi:hypothetical protein A9986_09955 [Solibacillus silvestris]|nr:hypothetical protein A9986_09955 [Solibacillus silvestris]
MLKEYLLLHMSITIKYEMESMGNMAQLTCHAIARLFLCANLFWGKYNPLGKSLSPKIPLKYTKLLYKYKEKSKNLHNSLLSPLYFAILLNIKLLGGRIWKVKLVRKNWLIGF